MLARLIFQALEDSTPVERFTHIPMLDTVDLEKFSYSDWQLISAARLARISYFKWSDDPNKDLDLAKKLIEKQHPSPFEHVAFAQDSNDYFANFKSWKQLRHVLKF